MISTLLNRFLKLRFAPIILNYCHLQPRVDARPDSLAAAFQNLAKSSELLGGE